MSTVEIETTQTELVPSSEVELRVADTEVTTVPRESIVEGHKKEYSIVGDGLYASISAEDAPAWLTGILDNVISAQLDSSLSELRQANQNILNSLSELEVAKNEYQELINIDATVEGVVASRLSTLNATVDDNSATISRLDATKVDESQAIAIAGNVIEAELNSGSIGARIGNLDTAIANTNGALASSVEVLEAQYDDVSSAVSTLENTVAANADQAMANFSYGATLKLDYNGTDYYYSSGFGLKTTLAGGTSEGAPSGNSEFWVNAEKFRFTNSNNTGQVAPFSIDASGTTPQVTFNGVVDFTNTNASGTTTIDGNKITAGTVDANRINASTVATSNLLVDQTIRSSDFTVIGGPGFRLKSNAAGTSADPTIYGAYIKASSVESLYVPVPGTNNYGNFNYASYGSTVGVVGLNYSSGYIKNRVTSLKDSTLVVKGFLNISTTEVSEWDISGVLQRSIDSQAYTTIQTKRMYFNLPAQTQTDSAYVYISININVTVWVNGSYGSGSGSDTASDVVWITITIAPKMAMTTTLEFYYIENLESIGNFATIDYRIPGGTVFLTLNN